MLTQINIPTNSESGVLPQLGDTKTFQKNYPKLLDRVIIDGKNRVIVSGTIKNEGSLKLAGKQYCFLET